MNPLPNDLEGEAINTEDSPSASGDIKASDNLVKDDPSLAAPPAYRQRGVSLTRSSLMWGPFHLPYLLGTMSNAYEDIYIVYVIFRSVWPPAAPLDAESINYTVVVTGGVMIFVTT